MPTAIYFDMDGTIADLYGFDGWLDGLLNEDTTPYCDCAPLFDSALIDSLHTLQGMGVRVGVISWGCKDSSDSYLARTRHAKAAWLHAHGFPCDELHVIRYGEPKAACAHVKRGSVLVDDSEAVRREWADGDGRMAIPPTECVEFVEGLILGLRDLAA